MRAIECVEVIQVKVLGLGRGLRIEFFLQDVGL